MRGTEQAGTILVRWLSRKWLMRLPSGGWCNLPGRWTGQETPEALRREIRRVRGDQAVEGRTIERVADQ